MTDEPLRLNPLDHNGECIYCDEPAPTLVYHASDCRWRLMMIQTLRYLRIFDALADSLDALSDDELLNEISDDLQGMGYDAARVRRIIEKALRDA